MGNVLRFPVLPADAETKLPGKIELIDEEGMHLLWLTPRQAREMVREGFARAVGTKKRVRVLIAIPRDLRAELEAEERGWGIKVNGRHFSHNAETETNPRGVWTFKRVA